MSRWYVEGIEQSISRRALTIGLVFSGVVGLTRIGWAEAGFRVVVNEANPVTSVTGDFLTELFLKRRVEWLNGSSARPVDLRTDSPVRREFSKSVLHRSVEAVKSYWQQMIFSGRGVPPPEVDSDEAVMAYVA